MQMHGDFSPPPKQVSQHWPASKTACSKPKYQDGRPGVSIHQKFMLSAVADTRGSGVLRSFHEILSLFRSLVGTQRHRCLSSPVWPLLPSSAAPHCDPGPTAPDSFCFPHLPSEESREVAGEKRESRRRLRAPAAVGKRKRFREQLPPTGAAGMFLEGGEIMDHPFMYSRCFWGACISSGPQGQTPSSPAARHPVNLAATHCCCCCFPPPPPLLFSLFLTRVSLMHDRY